MVNFFRLFLLCSMFLACTNGDNSAIVFDNTFEAVRNSEAWTGEVEMGLAENDTLVFLGIGNGLDNGVMVIKIKFDGVKSYELNGLEGRYYNTLGGDAIISQFEIQDQNSGAFNITGFNETTEEIMGSFDLPLKAFRLSSQTSQDSILTISRGTFQGIIREEPIQ